MTSTMESISKPSLSSDAPKLTVQPYTSSTGFTFPSLYSFPPFFTKQPNEQTWAHQRQQWITLVLAFTRFHRVFRLELSDETCSLELFNNKTIKRRLQLPALRSIIEAMVSAGSAEYDPPKTPKGQLPRAALIYWKRPEEWAALIYDWIKESGQTNSIMTFYELTEGGDLVHTTEFYQLPEPLLRKALDVLIRQGKAQVLKGLGEDGDGVKFV